MPIRTKPGRDQKKIAVIPPKDLFVEMLIRDISLEDAIVDLVDNCVDGAHRLRPEDNGSLEGLTVRIEVSFKELLIKDNCGGISVDTARNYAFRIGRPKDAPDLPGSIGRFGIGMKRAFFKMGNHFEVESRTSDSGSFSVIVDVKKWKEDDDDWSFRFANVDEKGRHPVEETGTIVRVSELHDFAAKSFGLENFLNRLSRRIQSAQRQFLARGLGISFNGRALIGEVWQLLHGNGLEPAFDRQTITDEKGRDLQVRIYSGIASSSPREAGWYVLCNGRIVLEADQTPVTGWNRTDELEVSIPQFHNQFARFRGYVFFDSRDAELLPYNTTKTGVDEDAPVYRSVRQKMVGLARPVIDFLNRLDSEMSTGADGKGLREVVRRAESVQLEAIARTGAFLSPPADIEFGPPMVSIQYSKERNRVNALKEVLKKRSAREVGETCFELIYAKQVGSDE